MRLYRKGKTLRETKSVKMKACKHACANTNIKASHRRLWSRILNRRFVGFKKFNGERVFPHCAVVGLYRADNGENQPGQPH